jgi:large conductance mechanosensitive channel
MIKEFKEFISKGNVMDMAVGIIIGSAFTAIVTALVDNIITPLLGIITGGVSFAERAVTVGTATLNYGLFIDAIIKFLLVALVLFFIVKGLNKAKKAMEKPEEPKEEEPAPVPEDIQLLTEIRDLLKK